jgi:hypothetical protein
MVRSRPEGRPSQPCMHWRTCKTETEVIWSTKQRMRSFGFIPKKIEWTHRMRLPHPTTCHMHDGVSAWYTTLYLSRPTPYYNNVYCLYVQHLPHPRWRALRLVQSFRQSNLTTRSSSSLYFYRTSCRQTYTSPLSSELH